MSERAGCGAIGVLLCVLVGIGCQVNRPNGPSCVQGMVTSCACDNGETGTQTCKDDNSYAMCICQLGVSTPSAGSGAKSSAGSGGGSGISTGHAGSSVSTGGNAPNRGGSGGGGTGGVVSSSGGRGGTGASGGTAGAPRPAGRGGGAGAAGSDANPNAYHACSSNSSCGGDLTCTFGVQQMMSNSQGYCSPSCGQGQMCPRANGATVVVVCVANVCVLGGCHNAQCPEGMSCVETTRGPGMAYSCAYPTK